MARVVEKSKLNSKDIKNFMRSDELYDILEDQSTKVEGVFKKEGYKTAKIKTKARDKRAAVDINVNNPNNLSSKKLYSELQILLRESSLKDSKGGKR